MSFLRTFQTLLPQGLAWRITLKKRLRQFFEGLSGLPTDAKANFDSVYDELWPDTTSQLAAWEEQFGIPPNPSESVRRQNLAAEWAAGGGQSPRYIQDVLRTAGFDVYVYESWLPGGPPFVARDPRLYTTTALIGSEQCTGNDPLTGEPYDNQPQCSDGLPDSEGNAVYQPQCDASLANDPSYFDNRDLTPRSPPPIPEDPAFWPFFIYIGGTPFPTAATIPSNRRQEFERLILKIKPAQNWIVTLTGYVPPAPPDYLYFGGGPGFGTGYWAPPGT